MLLSVVVASKTALKAACVVNTAFRLHNCARWLGLYRLVGASRRNANTEES